MIRKRAIYCCMYVFCALLVRSTFAGGMQGKPLPLPSPKTESLTPWLGLWEVSFALLIIVCLIFSIRWLFGRAGFGQKDTIGSSRRVIRIVERKPLGPRQSLVLVQCRDTEVLLHQSKGRLSTLCVIESTSAETKEDGEK